MFDNDLLNPDRGQDKLKDFSFFASFGSKADLIRIKPDLKHSQAVPLTAPSLFHQL